MGWGPPRYKSGMAVASAPVNRSALALYRELYRQTRALPRDSIGYYRNYLRCAALC